LPGTFWYFEDGIDSVFRKRKIYPGIAGLDAKLPAPFGVAYTDACAPKPYILQFERFEASFARCIKLNWSLFDLAQDVWGQRRSN
jgi:hypothetical protein